MSALILTLAALAAPAKRDDCRTDRCQTRVASKHCDQAHPRWCVEHAIRHERLAGWMATWMRRVPGCESGWNVYATNGHPSNRTPVLLIEGVSTGLFQFMPATWRTTPYARRWIFSARYQALAAGWMLRRGRAGEWACR